MQIHVRKRLRSLFRGRINNQSHATGELGDIGGKKSRPFNFDHIQILEASWLLNANLVQTEATLPSMDIRITSRGD
jgi:hypothetical protein